MTIERHKGNSPSCKQYSIKESSLFPSISQTSIMEETTKEEILNLEMLQTQLSDEEKTGNIGKVLNYVVTLFNSGWSWTRPFEDLASLQKIKDCKKEVENLFDKSIQENSRCNEKIVKDLNECSKKFSSCFDSNKFGSAHLKDILRDSEGNVEEIRKDVLSAIDEHYRSECNKVTQEMMKGKKVMAALFALKLYIAWKKISAASNVIKDKNKFTQIENNIKELEEKVANLDTICSDDPEQALSIQKEMMFITTTYTATLGLISDVRVKIDGYTQSLDLLADVTVVDSVMSLATAAAQGYELWSTWDNLKSATKWFGGVSTAIFTFVGIANAGVSALTRQKLEQLRKDLRTVNSFKCELDKLYNKAGRAIAGH